MTELTVLTFNIRHGLGTDDRLDLERIADVIEEHGADVVALQEVDRHFGPRSDNVDQPGWLGARLGMTPLFGAQVRDSAGAVAPPAEYGCAVLTNRPVVSSAFESLPTELGQEGRGLLHAVLDTGGSVQVGCVHLSHESADSRWAQVRAIGDIMTSGSTLVLGDFNAGPDSAEMQYLTKRFIDSWLVHGSGPGHTFDSQCPSQRIDYILMSPDVAATDVSVVGVGSASDHCALRATVTVPADS